MLRIFLVSLFFITPFKFYADEIKNTSHKAIIFDFGGVMVDFKIGDMLIYAGKEFKMPLDKFKGAIKKELNLMATGQLKEKDFWHHFAKKYQVDLPKNWEFKFKRFIKKHVKPQKKMYDLIVTLKRKGYQVSMLSDVTEWQASVFHKLNLYQGFDPLALSFEIKARKPFDESYLTILSMLKYTPQECIFVDDRIENIQAAQKLNIKAIHFESYEKLENDLKFLNILD